MLTQLRLEMTMMMMVMTMMMIMMMMMTWYYKVGWLVGSARVGWWGWLIWFGRFGLVWFNAEVTCQRNTVLCELSNPEKFRHSSKSPGHRMAF